jgi:hypothetical protein
MEILKRLKVLFSKCGTAKETDTKHFKGVGVEYEYNGKKLKFDELPKEEQQRIVKLQMQNIRSIGIPCVFTLDEQKAIQDNCSTEFILKVQDEDVEAFTKANIQ